MKMIKEAFDRITCLFRTGLMIILLSALCMNASKAQSQEVQQLLLNVEKLNQLKNILADMKKGYQIVSSGYSAVKNVTQGNFSMHEVFLDGLLVVNPEIKRYYRVKDIIDNQKAILTEYKSAFKRFKASGNFTDREINYFGNVYRQLFNQSLNNLDDLTTIITSSKLRMSDDERLHAIDRVFEDTRDKLLFLRHFNRQTSILNLQRTKEKSDIAATRSLY
jgi:hypothetical protein